MKQWLLHWWLTRPKPSVPYLRLPPPRWLTRRVTLPADLQCVLFIPDNVCETRDARRVVPQNISREDAVFNASRTALLVHALATNNLDDLVHATQDR